MQPKLKNEIKLLALICAQDGVLSKAETSVIYKEICEFENLKTETFNLIIDEFFEDTFSLEEYFKNLSGEIPDEKIVQIAFEAASSDGLDLRENFAYLKLCKLVGINPKFNELENED